MKPRNAGFKASCLSVDKELVIVFLLVVITAIISFFVSNQRAFLNFFYLPVLLGHHEKYDGNGYHSLVGEDIPLGARIIAVADVYDALTSDRPYRKALPPFYAKNEIVSNSGTHFDPQVVNVFETIFPTFDQEGTVPLRSLHG